MMNPYVLLAALVTIVVTAFGGAFVGAKLERASWQKEKLAMEAAHIAELTAEVDKRQRAEQFNRQKSRKASDDHEQAIKKLHQDYATDIAAIKRAGGLRIPRTCPKAPAGAAEGTSASGPDETSPNTEKLPDRIEERLFRLTTRADELAEQLRALQGWIVDNGFYEPAPQSTLLMELHIRDAKDSSPMQMVSSELLTHYRSLELAERPEPTYNEPE